jgi:NAD dependent epimerase/dehydratase family enzyme
MLRRLLLPFTLGLGGPIAGGRQWMSWISLRDHMRAMRFAITSDLSGPVNFAAPNPVMNADFTRALGRALRRPTVIPLPGFALRAVYGQMAEETILTSQRVIPSRLVAKSFTFNDPGIEGALQRELAPATK